MMNSAERPFAARNEPEEPMKHHDHAMDAMRYAVMAAEDLGPTVEYLGASPWLT